METKHLIALIGIVAVTCGSILATSFSQRLRDLAFFGMVFLAIYSEKLDVNFFGEYWYRGTSRGCGIALSDVLALAILVATFLAPRYPRGRWFPPASLGALLLYLAYAVFSTLTALQPRFAVWELTNIPRYILILTASAAYLRTRREFGILIVALACATCIQAVYALKQKYIGGLFRAAGTLDHPNSLSMYVCTVAPLLLAAVFCAWSNWLRLIAGIGCIAAGAACLATISRAGLPIFGLVLAGTAIFCVTWRITRRKIVVLSAIGACAGIVLVKSWDQIEARYAAASLAEEYFDPQAEGRGVYLRWARAIIKDHPHGVGINNWSYAVSKTYGPQSGFSYENYDDITKDPEKADLPASRYAAPAHSLLALTVGELGIAGLMIFGAVWIRWFQVGAGFLRGRLNAEPLHRLGIGCLFAAIGIFLQSLTEWTFRQPALFITFFVLMGGMASMHCLRKPTREEAEVEQPEEELDEPAFQPAPIHVSASPTRR